MLSVKCGAFQPELEAAFLKRLGELKARAPLGPLAVVAPSRSLADRLERLAAVEGGLSLLGVHFHTFYSLAVVVVEESGWPEKRLVSDPVFHDRVVDGLLEEDPALAGTFGGKARPRALARALRASLRDLIDAGVCAESLEEHFGDALLRELRDRERLAALLRLARAYERRLEELGVLSSSGLTRLAAERAEGSRALGSFAEILYYGFYDLTGLQLEFFEAVASRCPATLFFPYRRGQPAYRFAQPFFEQKLLRYDVEELDSGPTPAPELKAISASGAADEVWAAAKEILRLVEDEGYRHEDIGVVARTLDPYRGVVAGLFAREAIPLRLGSGEPLLRHPAAKGALNLLSLRRRDFPAVLVEDLFSSPYFKAPAGCGPRTLPHWRETIRHLRIHGGWLQWRKLEGRLGADLELRPDQVREGRRGHSVPKEDVRSLWGLVSGLERDLGARARSWEEHSRLAVAVLARHWGPPPDPAGPESAAFAAVEEALSSMALFDLLGRPPTWEEFLDCLEEKFRAAEIEDSSQARGVRVLDAMEARGESFKVLFLIGLKEKLFPRPIEEDPILRDSGRAALRHPAGYWIGLKASGHEEERLLFHLLVGSARERLYAVYPRSDEAGKAEVPSLYLRELCRAAGMGLSEPTRHWRVPREPVEKLRQGDWARLCPQEVSLRLALDGGSPGDYLKRVGRDGDFLDSCLERVPALLSRGGPGPMDGVVSPPREFLEELRARGLSPSALESFAQCPFQFFADRVLGLGRREAAAEKGEFAAWVRGRIYHEALRRFYANATAQDSPPTEPRPSPRGRAAGLCPPTGGKVSVGGAEPLHSSAQETWESLLEAAVEDTFREFGWRELGVYPLLWLAAKDQMSARLREFAAWDRQEQAAAGFKPLWLEKDLQAPLPAKLPEGLGDLRLRGIVDRVDVDSQGERFRVIDYKTRWRGRAKLESLVARGQSHQLPVYAELAGRELGGARLDAAALYALEDSPEFSGYPRRHVYEGEAWRRDREGFFARLAASVEEIAAGRYPIRPDDGEFGACRFCDFALMCRKGHGPSRRRAEAAVSRGSPPGR